MKASTIWQEHPLLYHMASAGSWTSIARYGLLSTTALLDLFEYRGSQRVTIESRHRPESIPITHRILGTAIIRDQKPMSDGGLRRCLQGVSPRAWYELLNGKVFFWLTEERLLRMLTARAYREVEQDVLIVDAKSLVTEHEIGVQLSPINSGCTKPYPQPREAGTFRSIKEYPYEQYKKKRGSGGDAIVELAVTHSVPRIINHVIRVERRKGKTVLGTIWHR